MQDRKAVLAWLQEPDNPPVRYLASTTLLTPMPTAAELAELRAKALAWEPLREILAHQMADGSFPDAGKRPTALPTVNGLHLMARCGMRVGDEPVDRALGYVRRKFTKDGIYSWAGGGSGVLPCHVGIYTRTLIRLAGVEAARQHIDWVCEYQRFDHKETRGGGSGQWPYKAVDSYGGCWWSVSCYHGVVATFAALAAIPEDERTDPVRERLSEAIEYLRIHRGYKKTGSGKPLFRHLLQYFLLGGHRLHLIDLLEALADADPGLGAEGWVADAVAAVDASLVDKRVLLVKNYPSKIVDPIPLEAVGQPSRFLTWQWQRVLHTFGLV